MAEFTGVKIGPVTYPVGNDDNFLRRRAASGQ
jgi:hypothetical protein